MRRSWMGRHAALACLWVMIIAGGCAQVEKGSENAASPERPTTEGRMELIAPVPGEAMSPAPAAQATPAVEKGVEGGEVRTDPGLHRQCGDLHYLIDLPKGYEEDPNRRWPLVLFLHGAGERGEDLSLVRVHGPPQQVAAGEAFPFILVSPQCPKEQWWSVEQLAALLDEVEATCRIDPYRIYCTGLSMGGFGTWALACAYPDRFAAIAPICGGGDPEIASRIAHLPCWVFHGQLDAAVPIAKSAEMVQALRASGSRVGFTVYPEATHNSWTQTYENPRFYAWLLANTRTRPVWPEPEEAAATAEQADEVEQTAGTVND